MIEAFIIFVGTIIMDAGATYVVANVIATAVAYAAVIAVNMAVSRLLAPKMPAMGDLNNRGIMTRSPISARQIIYGQAKVSGTVVFLATSGAKNEYLHIVVTLAGHEVEEIGSVYFNEDEVLTGSGDGYATGKYAPVVNGYTGSLIHKHLGSTTQTVDETLEDDFPVDWDSNHRLRGIAYIYCKLTFSNEIFVGGIPNISCVVKGKKVYNPSTLATAYSANPALCLRDYLLDADLGMGMDASEIDDTSVIAAAAVCNGQVEIKPVTSPATYENRYECNGQAVTSSTPDSIIGQILSSMGGTIAYSGGQVVVYAAAYRSPTVTLDETNMAGGFTVSTRLSARDRVNAVKGTFISSENQWAAADFPQITSATYLADDDGIYHWRDVILPFTTSSSAAQRIARINLRQAREEIIFTAKFNLTAMQLRAGDTVMLTNANLGFSSKVFEVIAWSLSSQGTPPTPVIELQLRETASTVYDWDVADEVAVESAPNTTLPNPFSIDPPTNLTLTADGTTQFIQADGSVVPRIKVAWSAPTEQFVTSGGKTVIEYKEGTATTYLTWATVDGDQTLDFISSDVRIGTSYNVRLYAQSFFNTSSTYTAVSTTTPVKDTTAPSVPTGLSAVVGTGRAVSLDWNDNTEPDFSEYGIYRRTTPVTPQTSVTSKIAEVRASRFVDTDVTIGTTYYYWLNAYDSVENVSDFTNYVQATPSVITAGPIDPTPPSTPAAPTLISTTVYLSSDGGSFARVSLTAPPLPSGAVALDVLYRRTGASDYIVGNQIASSVSYAVSIDDLTVGESYQFAARGISFSGAISPISTALSQSAPSNTTLPTTPSGGSISNKAATILTFSGNDTFFGARVQWSPSPDKDFAYFDIKVTQDNDSSSVNYVWSPEGATADIHVTREPLVDYYRVNPINGFVFVRAFNRSGTASAYYAIGNLVDEATYISGDMALQNKSSVTITGGTVTGITDIALADGGTGASTAANARINLLPAYAGNGLKNLTLNSGATDVEWSAAGSGTVTSVELSGGSTGLTVSGSPVTTSGTITIAGTLALANGGTGATTDSGARTALGLGTAATADLDALGAITVDKISFTGGDPDAYIDETWGITLNGDATRPVRVVNAALAMGSFDAGGSMTAGRIYLAEDRSLFANGTDLLFDNGSVTISITAAPVVPVVTTVILGYPLCSTYGGTDGDYLRQISYNSVTYLCFGA